MSDAKYTYEQLVEKIIRARIHLEKVRSAPHATTCPVEDPESYAPCNCGTSDRNRPVEEALSVLKL
jgi:hypothetical protein